MMALRSSAREIRPSNRILEKRRNLAFVPLMQNLKLLMQTGILVANMVGKHDLGEARISNDQFDVTQKHLSQHPDGKADAADRHGLGTRHPQAGEAGATA